MFFEVDTSFSSDFELRTSSIVERNLYPTTEEQKSILELFNCGYLVESSYLRSIGIWRV